MGPMIWEVSKEDQSLGVGRLPSALQLVLARLARFLWLQIAASSSGGRLHVVNRIVAVFETL